MLGLRPLLSGGDDEGHPLPGREDAPGDDGGGVHEHLRTPAVRRGEPVALGRLVPGDGGEHAQGRVGRDVPGDSDVQRLWTAGSLTGLELYRLALAQRPGRALALHLRDVHEDVGAAVVGGEEAEAALEVVPADGSLLHSALLVSRVVGGPVSQAPDPRCATVRRYRGRRAAAAIDRALGANGQLALRSDTVTTSDDRIRGRRPRCPWRN